MSWLDLLRLAIAVVLSAAVILGAAILAGQFAAAQDREWDREHRPKE